MLYNLNQLRNDFAKGKELKYIFFWGHQPASDGKITKSCLSQWWPAEFKINEVTYFSAEHYMMAEKARIFNDFTMLEKILHTQSPKQVKQFGREVKNFDKNIWEQHREEVIKRGNIAKFSQNKELKEYLLSTKNKVLVEASPLDKIWGIGLSEQEKDAQNPLLWKGLNLLGFVLMEVRDELYKNEVNQWQPN